MLLLAITGRKDSRERMSAVSAKPFQENMLKFYPANCGSGFVEVNFHESDCDMEAI